MLQIPANAPLSAKNQAADDRSPSNQISSDTPKSICSSLPAGHTLQGYKPVLEKKKNSIRHEESQGLSRVIGVARRISMRTIWKRRTSWMRMISGCEMARQQHGVSLILFFSGFFCQTSMMTAVLLC